MYVAHSFYGVKTDLFLGCSISDVPLFVLISFELRFLRLLITRCRLSPFTISCQLPMSTWESSLPSFYTIDFFHRTCLCVRSISVYSGFCSNLSAGTPFSFIVVSIRTSYLLLSLSSCVISQSAGVLFIFMVVFLLIRVYGVLARLQTTCLFFQKFDVVKQHVYYHLVLYYLFFVIIICSCPGHFS